MAKYHDVLESEWFKVPNFFVDNLQWFLTPQEFSLLIFITREIFGFEKNRMTRRKNISLSVMVEGKRSKENGTYINNGCGMSKGAVLRALKALLQYNILIFRGYDRNKGNLYELNTDAIDFEGLKSRKDEKSRENYYRTCEAREAKSE